MSSTAKAARTDEPLLSVRGLVTEFKTRQGPLRAVDEVSFEVDRGETLAIVGESGSGKSVTALSVLRLLPPGVGRIVAGEVRFDGADLLRQPRKALRDLRGSDVAMVFQDPTAFLNPTLTIGLQLVEAIRAHDRSISSRRAAARAVELLELVGVPGPTGCMRQYPHEYSGGMLQRVMIAMAISNRPRLLIADEPTTALDMTIQAQVVDVLTRVQEETGAAMILITHDLGLAAEVVDRVAVMYAGRIVETASVGELFTSPRHPYTVGLLASLPQLDVVLERLPAIPGQPLRRQGEKPACVFEPRCRLSGGRERCRMVVPPLVEHAPGHRAACHFAGELPARRDAQIAQLTVTEGAA